MYKTKQNFALFILIFINFIFCYKYFLRHTEFAVLLTLLICSFQVVVFTFKDRIPFLSNKNLKKFILISSLIFLIVLIIFSHLKIDLSTLNTDRHSVISSFLDEFFKGNYPYYAKSHLGNYPGPMPIYYFVALPFYMLGELSILSALGFIVFIIFIYKNANAKSFNVICLILITSFYLIWEILVRSNLFTFSLLLVIALNYYQNNIDNFKSRKLYFSAIICGLLLSTRSIYILPFIVFFLSNLVFKKINFKETIYFGLILGITFCSTFLPFIIMFPKDFIKMNPFIIQSSFFVPIYMNVLFMISPFIVLFFSKQLKDKFFFSGLSLFLCILFYALFILIDKGYQKAYLDSFIDISYFIFCIPFF